MNISIELAAVEQKELLTNLMEKYFYEFAQWSTVTMDEKGLYGCDEMVDKYFQNEKCFPYIIHVDDKIAGFAVAIGIDREKFGVDFYIAEFFIIYDYRKQGVGKVAANSIFDKHKGKWDLFFTPRNLLATKFWPKVISEYTGGKYKMTENCPKTPASDGTLCTVLVFENN